MKSFNPILPIVQDLYKSIPSNPFKCALCKEFMLSGEPFMHERAHKNCIDEYTQAESDYNKFNLEA